jgi:UDP-GlcNAc:undecaprenyl-phosphate GlcNAc-1-phosphate transferase
MISVFLLGFWDDLKPLKPGIKFGVQFLIAGIIYFAGFKISNITNPLGGEMLNVEIIDFPLTLIWIVGITNAFNLIDGLDGLASGVATIAAVSIFTVAALSGDIAMALLALVLAGALVGFLRYNFNPARIFLGDSGSLLIGFSLALMSIHSTTKITTGFALLFPLLVLMLPITDTLVSMIRRMLGSILKEKDSGSHESMAHKIHGMFTPDKSHIHHQLLSMGLSHRNTVLALYGISAFFALGAFAITQIDSFQESLVIAILFAAALIYGIRKLRYHEIEILNNGIFMPFYERWILSKAAYLSIFDLCFIMISYSLSFLLVQNILPSLAGNYVEIGQTFVIIISAQMCIFWLSGLYKQKLALIGIGSILNIISVVGYSVFTSCLILYYRTEFPAINIVSFFIFNFYFLLTLTLGFRLAYQVLSYLFNKEKRSSNNVLIYGTGENGAMIMNRINNTPKNGLKVLGFLDDDPEMENKNFYGYPVLGGHWHLPKIIQHHNNIDSIYISEESLKPENLRRLSKIAYSNNIKIKQLKIRVEDIIDAPEKITNGVDHKSPATFG